jgi:hypothetical protein
MLKRDLPRTAIRAEGPHAKKRRDEISQPDNISMDDPTANGYVKAGERASAVKDREPANSQGLVLWQTVKDAVNKECVMICFAYSIFDSHPQNSPDTIEIVYFLWILCKDLQSDCTQTIISKLLNPFLLKT